MVSGALWLEAMGNVVRDMVLCSWSSYILLFSDRL